MEDEDNRHFNDIDPDINHFSNDTINCKTYTVDTFRNSFDLENNSLNIFHNNAQSIMKHGKLQQYSILFKSIIKKLDVIIFTETWNTEERINLCSLEGYIPVHLLRQSTDAIDLKEKGGGVSIFIKDE